MSGSSDKKEQLSDECDDLASLDQQQQISDLIRESKLEQDQAVDVNNEDHQGSPEAANDDIELSNDNIDDYQQDYEAQPQQEEIDLDRESSIEFDVDNNVIAEESFDLSKSVNSQKIANDSSSDDLLTVPAFFRRKKG